MYKTIKFQIEGVAPLLMHNCRLANPADPFTRAMKQITAKRTGKTDADLEELSRLEFMGGLYVNADGAPCVPGECIEGMICEGAKKSRKGKDSKAGVISDGLWPLIYDGPKDADALWASGKFVDVRGAGVAKSRIMRTRPRFDSWKLKFDVAYNPEVVNDRDLRDWVAKAGEIVGLLDFRPRYGRFVVV